MSDVPLFTAAQTAEINRLLDSKKEEFGTTATSAVATAFADSREAIVTSLGEKVKEAIKTNQSVVLATVQSAEKTSENKRLLEWAKLLVPILATALLGYLVWRWQHAAEDRSRNAETKLAAKIDQNTKFLEAQLALKQEYYKRKMDVFQEIAKQMAVVNGDANTAYVNAGEMTKAINSLAELSRLIESNKLYVTDKTQTVLLDFWNGASQLARKKIKPADLDAKQSTAWDQVFKELELSDMSTLPHPKVSP